MRYVLHRPGGTITPRDLGKDARDSYLAGDFGNPVTIRGGFQGHDFRNASIAHAVVDGDWSDTKIQYLTSFASDWSGCVLPADFPLLRQNDLVVGLLKRRLAAAPVADRDAILSTANHLATYGNCGPTNMDSLSKTGLTNAEMLAIAKRVFDGYPRLVEQTERTLAGDEGEAVNNPAPANHALYIAGTEIDLLRDPRVRGEDRWAIERSLEVPGWRVHLFTLHPWPYGKAAQESVLGIRGTWWNWWRGLGGNQ